MDNGLDIVALRCPDTADSDKCLHVAGKVEERVRYIGLIGCFTSVLLRFSIIMTVVSQHSERASVLNIVCMYVCVRRGQ